MLPPIDFDGPWKEALDVYLPDILAFFFPDAHAEIDWAQDYRPLEQELQQIAPDAAGAQAVDKLVEVRRRDGSDAWVLIHIEIQSQPDAAFAERMFRYHARLYDRSRQQIASFAILGDDRPNWRPSTFGYTLWRCALRLDFPTVKLLDYDLAILEASTNPCATVVLAHRLAQATRHNPAGRMDAKLTLARRLYRQGRTREEIVRLYRFIDWLLRLPADLEQETWRQIKAFEEEQQMAYITSAERFGIAEAVANAHIEGIAVALELKFGDAGTALVPEIRQIDDSELLHAILMHIKTAATPDDVRALYADRH